jgi:hypothetical protein
VFSLANFAQLLESAQKLDIGRCFRLLVELEVHNVILAVCTTTYTKLS